MRFFLYLREKYSVLPVMSQNVYETDTRFGKAREFIEKAEKLSGRQVLHTIVEAEPIGPKGLVDAMVVCPCTGNTLSKIAGGITDTSVTMAVKSSLRIGIPVLLCVASNDSLGASGANCPHGPGRPREKALFPGGGFFPAARKSGGGPGKAPASAGVPLKGPLCGLGNTCKNLFFSRTIPCFSPGALLQ